MDPLTKEERDSLMRQLELHLSHLHVNSEDTHHMLKKCGVWNIMRDEIDRLCREVEAMQKVVEAAKTGASAVRGLMSDSRGVDGYHRNGDIATWGELERGGRYACIAEFNDLEDALAKLKGGAT